MNSIIKAIRRAATGEKALNSVHDSRGWYPIIRESYGGAWQRNVTVNADQAMAFHAVYACTTLIAGDIAKLRAKLTENNGGVWTETTNPAFSPLLARPNHFQTRNQFFENWVLSRLMRGNAYILKERNSRNVVTALYVLDPSRVRPLVSDDGQIYYELRTDNISGIREDIIVPAREIIHDRSNCLFHPLVGVPPIYACGLAATHGLAIQNSQAKLFENAAQPGGLLIAPGKIDDENAKRLKEYWDSNFRGDRTGQVAVLGDGLKYEKLSLTAEEAQLIDQLKMTAEVVCSVFHIPPHMVGVGPVPSLGNVEALAQLYYSQALQSPIEAIESCLDVGLDLPGNLGVEFDLAGLLRMDTATQVKALGEAVGASILAPNEARAQLGYLPVDGGESPMAQQQDFSLAALAERDRNKPFTDPTSPIGTRGVVKMIKTRRDDDGNLIAEVSEDDHGTPR